MIHYWEDGRNELYSGDPFNEQMLTNQKVLETELWNELEEWLSNSNAQLPEADPEYNPIADQSRDSFLLHVLLPRLENQRRLFLSDTFDPGNNWWGSDID